MPMDFRFVLKVYAEITSSRTPRQQLRMQELYEYEGEKAIAVEDPVEYLFV